MIVIDDSNAVADFLGYCCVVIRTEVSAEILEEGDWTGKKVWCCICEFLEALMDKKLKSVINFCLFQW